MTSNFLVEKDRLRLAEIASIGSFNFEYLVGVVERISSLVLFLLDFVIEEPLVDLNPGETSLAHRFIFHFFRDLAVMLVEDSQKHVNLSVRFSASVVLVIL